ncbi:MAG: M16 family metallopeptidase [Bryobacteraceae bacterium]
MSNRKLRIILTAALVISPLAAQEQSEASTFKGVVRLNKAPVSTEVLRVKLPRPEELKLKNGLAVLVLEDHRIPTFSLTLELPVSTLADPLDLHGIGSVTATMLTLGTKKMDARTLAERLADLGGSLNAGAGHNSIAISASGLIDNLDELLGLFQDVLLTPTFPQDELDKWKQRQLANLQQARTNPGFLANERLSKILYPNDARGFVAMSEAVIRKLTRQNLVDYYESRYAPAPGGLIGVAGDVSRREIVSRLEKLLEGWKPAKIESPNIAFDGQIAEKRVILVDRPNSVQTFLFVGNRAISRTDPDYIACMVMNRVLGQGPSARLFRNIREDKGYTYGISSLFDATKYLNDFTVNTSVRTEVTGPALEELLKEFRDIRDRPVPADELEGAKRALVAGFALGLESSAGLLGRAISLRHYGLPADYWDRYPEMIMKVTAAQVQQVARKYVPVDNVQIVAVGDASKIRELLKKFGPLEEYNADGVRVTAAGGAE